MRGAAAIERAAAGLIERSGLRELPLDLEELARRCGARVVYEVFDDATSGFLLRSGVGQATICINADHAPNRQRFTLAHELGHLELHNQELYVDQVLVMFRSHVGPGDQFDRIEWEANVFAAELLMPEKRLRAELRQPVDAFDEGSMRRLAARYGVSQQALTIRLTRLGLLDGLPGAVDVPVAGAGGSARRRGTART